MMTRQFLPVLMAISAISCSAPVDDGAPSAEAGIPATEIGLSRTGITDVPSPEPVPFNTSDPGERALPDRAYPGAPPVIPHATADLLPITRNQNFCLDCHAVEEKEEGGPTPVPRSHYVDLRDAPSEVRQEIAGARYNCVACHAPQTDASPLVSNRMGL